VGGLLADLPRKHCWTIAEHAGDASPDGMQHLLARAVSDEDAVRDDVRAYVVEHLGDPGAVLVIDATGGLKKGTTTVGCNASTPAPPGGSTTPRSRSTWSTPPALGTPWSTGRCTCPGPGPTIPSACRRPVSPTRSGSRPSRLWPRRCWPAPLTPASQQAGSPATRSTAPTPNCGPSWKPDRSATCWRSPATTASGSAAPPTARTPCSPKSRRGHGSACRPAGAPRATATTTGRCCAWTTPAPGLAARQASTG